MGVNRTNTSGRKNICKSMFPWNRTLFYFYPRPSCPLLGQAPILCVREYTWHLYFPGGRYPYPIIDYKIISLQENNLYQEIYFIVFPRYVYSFCHLYFNLYFNWRVIALLRYRDSLAYEKIPLSPITVSYIDS